MTEYHCCDQKFDHAKFVDHLKMAHRLQPGTKCKMSMISALDGSNFYQNTFEIEIPCGTAIVKAIKIEAGNRGHYNDTRRSSKNSG